MNKKESLKLYEKLASKIRIQPCIVCRVEPAGHCDHILTRGSRPDLVADPVNLWALCGKHHDEKGRSLTAFIIRYNLHDELSSRGFEYNDYSGKWYLKFKGENMWL